MTTLITDRKLTDLLIGARKTILNVGKTKEMVIDFRRNKPNYKPIMVKGEAVEQVDKYLGLVIDNKLVWHENTDEIIKKVHSRLFCLKKLRSFRMREDILEVFSLSTISSVLTNGCVCWGGTASKQDRDRREKTTRKAGGMTGRQQETFDAVCHRPLTDRLSKICLTTHIL